MTHQIQFVLINQQITTIHISAIRTAVLLTKDSHQLSRRKDNLSKAVEHQGNRTTYQRQSSRKQHIIKGRPPTNRVEESLLNDSHRKSRRKDHLSKTEEQTGQHYHISKTVINHQGSILSIKVHQLSGS